ncbi:MAG: tRNA guanosine(34) transglycosylase Tgt [Spirochaetales bacterium]|nr:tRNA guanosine(34) transglycosylase Tgt [Spirochaetales bacterium]
MEKLFNLIHKDSGSSARTGNIRLSHGNVKTPAFMPVGTNGTVKAVHHSTVDKIGYKLILGNTYHLYLRPGLDVIKEFESLHKFSNWKHNILTDSGGFQVFSLAALRKIKKEGVTFRSHIDGSYHELTPEKVVDAQIIFNSDISMCLDVCTPPSISEREAIDALKITHTWAERSLKHRNNFPEYSGNLFGIIQGNFFKDLRKKSALIISELGFPGIAIGGLSVGEPFEVFKDMLSHTVQFIPVDRPLYVMGIGTPEYILEAVENGVDLFDCVFATRTARNGAVFTNHGMINLKKSFNKFSREPIVEGCSCAACTQYSKGYLHHLFKANEMLGPMLASEHNLTFLYDFLFDIRKNIQSNSFKSYKNNFLEMYGKKK